MPQALGFLIDFASNNAAFRCQELHTKGVILNRPTAFSTGDLESSMRRGATGSAYHLARKNFSKQGADDWNVWCGGDCQGVNDRKPLAAHGLGVALGSRSIRCSTAWNR